MSTIGAKRRPVGLKKPRYKRLCGSVHEKEGSSSPREEDGSDEALYLRWRMTFVGRMVKSIRVIRTLRRRIARSVWIKMENQTLLRGSVGLMRSCLVARSRLVGNGFCTGNIMRARPGLAIFLVIFKSNGEV